MRLAALCTCALLTLLLVSGNGSADISPYISYQGVLRDAAGDHVSDGTYGVEFKIYEVETGGSELWAETQSVMAADGIVNVLLGAVMPLNTLAFDVPYWLGISIEGEAELAPRTPFTSVPYAAHAGFADTVLEGDDDWTIVGDDISHDGGTVAVTGELSVSGSAQQKQVYFSSDSSHSNARVVSSEYTAPGSVGQPVAFYGESVPADEHGIGGQFKGGLVGVSAQVAPTGSGPLYRALLANCNGGSGTNHGVYANAQGTGTNYGIWSQASGGIENWAGHFSGDVGVTATLTAGQKNFRIDHPLDPENMYLQHSCIESDEVLNVYNGNVVLDGAGEAWVEMPEWFEALNADVRYQLTCIGGFAPVYIAEEINGNSFRIAGGEPGMKVSWLVSGVRSDPFTRSRGLEVELPKTGDEAGRYMHPEAYGLPRSAGIDYREGPAVPGVSGATE